MAGLFVERFYLASGKIEFLIQIANGISNTDSYNSPLLCFKESHVDFPNKYVLHFLNIAFIIISKQCRS